MNNKGYFMRKTGLIVIFWVLINSISCTNNTDRTTKLFKSFLYNQLDTSIKEDANYLVITYMGCTGCVHKGIDYINKYPNYITSNFEKVIYSKTLLERIPAIDEFKRNSICDTSDRIEILNLGISGFSIIRVRNGLVSEIRNLNTKDIRNDSTFIEYISSK